MFDYYHIDYMEPAGKAFGHILGCVVGRTGCKNTLKWSNDFHCSCCWVLQWVIYIKCSNLWFSFPTTDFHSQIDYYEQESICHFLLVRITERVVTILVVSSLISCLDRCALMTPNLGNDNAQEQGIELNINIKTEGTLMHCIKYEKNIQKCIYNK